MSPRMHGGPAAGTDPLTGSLRLYPNPLRQALSASTWRATWYLVAYLVVSWLLFSAVLTAGITAAILAIMLAGLPLLIAAAAVIRGCASAERWRLRPLLGHRVRGSYRDLSGRGLAARVRASWTDLAVWRDLAYLGGLLAAARCRGVRGRANLSARRTCPNMTPGLQVVPSTCCNGRALPARQPRVC
jgi:hypothetical protein